MKRGLINTAFASTLAISLLLVGCGTKAAPKELYTYVGSVDLSAYHYKDCTAANKIKDADKVWFSDVSEAKSYGYHACKMCKTPVK